MGLFQEFGKGGSGASRCDLKENLLNGGCSSAALESPTSSLTIQDDAPLSDKASGTTDTVTQIKPQKLRMVLRPGTQPDINYGSSSQPAVQKECIITNIVFIGFTLFCVYLPEQYRQLGNIQILSNTGL